MNETQNNENKAIIPSEMARLRTMLTDMGVEWWDDSNITLTYEYEVLNIYRTKFKYEGSEFSVIYGQNTYGYDKGLLEVWDYREEEPTGYHTADDVIAMMKGEYKG